MNYWLILVVIIFAASARTNADKNPCIHASTCGQCLEAYEKCYWCADNDYTDDESARKSRCNLRPLLQGCRNIQINDGSVKTLLDSNFGSKVQVKPQKVKVSLRPGQVQSFTFSVKPAQNYPVRLYYLMDMSNSMEDDLKKLQTLGTKIANEIKSVTEDYKLAFGTFVDKPVSPFVHASESSVHKPCDRCAPTFGFKHVFDFNTDATQFESAVSKQKISGNLDSAEGGFDALMQVAVCEKEIKWDPIGQSRRIVVFVTDAPPHIAGDGKIGGITLPNDGKCYLSKRGNSKYLMYDKSTDMDYPSLSHLKSVLKENKVVPIIAVTSEVKPLYDKIAREWKDIGASIGVLEKDSSNIVDLIHDTYKGITTTIRASDDSSGTSIVVKYKVIGGCPHGGSTEENGCKDVAINEKVDITASLKVTTCPKNWKKGEIITITVPGFGDVEVDVSMICECDCVTNVQPSASKCNGKGSLTCGICACDVGRFGERCECDSTVQADTTLCVMPNTTRPDLVCSGFGSCVCRKCECVTEVDESKIISGKYCECNNFGCDRYEGKICGGLERGICKCGQCVCVDEFLGENCGHKNCTKGKKNCVKDGIVCGGNGVCNCDHCECEAGCSGTYCDSCLIEGVCKHHEACVKCEFEIAEYCDKCFLENITFVKVVENDTIRACGDLDYSRTDKCIVTLGDGREIHYVIDENDGETTTEMEACILPMMEAETIPILFIVIGIIGGIVGIVLILLLIWKVLVTIYDRREFEKFNESLQNPTWQTEQNPIYKKATSSFKNPMYRGNNT